MSEPKYIPKSITLLMNVHEEIVHMACFSYSDGVNYCKQKGIEEGLDMYELFEGKIYITYGDEVEVVVGEDEFPDIIRDNGYPNYI